MSTKATKFSRTPKTLQLLVKSLIAGFDLVYDRFNGVYYVQSASGKSLAIRFDVVMRWFKVLYWCDEISWRASGTTYRLKPCMKDVLIDMYVNDYEWPAQL